MPGVPIPFNYFDSKNNNKKLYTSKFLTEKITPLENIYGVKGKPSVFMQTPESCLCDSLIKDSDPKSLLLIKSNDNLKS